MLTYFSVAGLPVVANVCLLLKVEFDTRGTYAVAAMIGIGSTAFVAAVGVLAAIEIWRLRQSVRQV